MITNTVTLGDYKANLYKYKLGYQYKIFAKIKGKNTCVARNYTYIFNKDDCYRRMLDDLHSTIGIVKDLFH